MGVGFSNEKWDTLYKRACKISVDRKAAKVLRLTSVEASRLFSPGSLDFVYIDADHKYSSVVEDIDHWLPKVRVGGMIGGHDYSNGWPSVVEAVNDKLGEPKRGPKGTWWVKV